MSLPDFESLGSERFRILAQVSQQISSILEINQLLVEIARLIQQTFGYYHVGIGLLEGDEVVYRVGAGELWERSDFQFKPARLKIGKEGIAGYVAASGLPHLAPDVRVDPYYVWMQGSATQSELIVPVNIKGKVIGVLDLQSDKLNDFSETDIALMLSLANQAAVAIENARLFATEQRRAEQFRAVSEVGRHIAAIFELDSLLEQLAKSIQQAFNYYLVEIGLVDGSELVFKARAGRQPETDFATFRLKCGEGITGLAVATGKTWVVPDVNREPRFVRCSHHETRSELAVPIQTKGRVIGVLNIQSDQFNAFDPSDEELMQALANQAGVAIENCHLYQKAQQVAVLEERQRMARELHDSVTQSLHGASIYSQAAARQLAQGNYQVVAEHLHRIQDITEEALAETRLLIYELRPPVLEAEGLQAALEARFSSVEERMGLKTTLKVALTERLPLALEEALYRIANEALTNTLKHAAAKNIHVSLARQEEKVVMEICDDGVGFDSVTRHFAGRLGLNAMQERAEALGGHLNIRSQPGAGTCIRVEVAL